MIFTVIFSIHDHRFERLSFYHSSDNFYVISYAAEVSFYLNRIDYWKTHREIFQEELFKADLPLLTSIFYGIEFDLFIWHKIFTSDDRSGDKFFSDQYPPDEPENFSDEPENFIADNSLQNG